MNKIVKFCLSVGLLFPLGFQSADAKTIVATGKGSKGQILTVTPGASIKDNQVLTVTGRNYQMNVGIYVAFCEIPTKGKKPEHCSGGINMDGTSKGSVWISSNPPWYIPSALLTPFGKGGTFKVQVTAVRFIDKTDCKVKKCGVITRADHTRGDYRLADVLVPLTFK